MCGKKELIEGLNNFAKSFTDLYSLLEDVDLGEDNDINDYIVDKYPFDVSLDDMEYHVSTWTNSIIDKLNNIE